MPDGRRELASTRVALLELKDEQQLVQEGYRLLDEKRILLAGEIRRQLTSLRAHRRELGQAEQAARAAFEAALRRHGLDSLAVHAPASLAQEALVPGQSRLLGLTLLEARLRPPGGAVPHGMPADAASAEVRECARAWRELLAHLVALAACEVSLRRLTREYVRTERRTRAIENILLPEIESAVRFVEELLDGLDQEEFARLRAVRGGRAGLGAAQEDPG
jgi:V/A-type H+/Na+-transporting ATPase subunit D